MNHARLAPGTPHRLGEGDLTLGAHRLQFWLGHRTIWEPHLRRHDVSPILAALAAVSGPNASLVLLDIDRLYRLNRLHPDGLLAGDAALAQVAQPTSRWRRRTD